MKRLRQGFVFLPLLILLLVLGAVGYFFYQNLNLKKKTTDENAEAKAVPSDRQVTPSVSTKTEMVDSWEKYSNDKMGFYFKYPKGWEVVKAFGDDYEEFDIKNPEKDTLFFISVHEKEKSGSGFNLQNWVSEREKEIRSNEGYEVLDFKNTSQGNVSSYFASGEEQNFNFAETNVTGYPGILNYKFQEMGMFTENGATIVLHGLTRPGSRNDEILTQMFEGFGID